MENLLVEFNEEEIRKLVLSSRKLKNRLRSLQKEFAIMKGVPDNRVGPILSEMIDLQFIIENIATLVEKPRPSKKQ
jgi:hypothetical protein